MTVELVLIERANELRNGAVDQVPDLLLAARAGEVLPDSVEHDDGVVGSRTR